MTDPIPIGDDDLQAYVDGRLRRERRDSVEAYLALHPEVAARAQRYVGQADMLASALRPVFEEPVPAQLRIASIMARRRQRRIATLARAACVVFLVGASGLAGWFAHDLGGRGTDLTEASSSALAAFQTFSVEVRHPVEVRATEEPHLVQWLSNRLNRPLAPPDLSAEGFRLMGGRVLPTSGTPAALLMYDDNRGTRLTVYAQPLGIEGTDFRIIQHHGIVTVTWAEEHLALALTAQLPSGRMLDLAKIVRGAFAAASPVPNP